MHRLGQPCPTGKTVRMAGGSAAGSATRRTAVAADGRTEPPLAAGRRARCSLLHQLLFPSSDAGDVRVPVRPGESISDRLCRAHGICWAHAAGFGQRCPVAISSPREVVLCWTGSLRRVPGLWPVEPHVPGLAPHSHTQPLSGARPVFVFDQPRLGSPLGHRAGCSGEAGEESARCYGMGAPGRDRCVSGHGPGRSALSSRRRGAGGRLALAAGDLPGGHGGRGAGRGPGRDQPLQDGGLPGAAGGPVCLRSSARRDIQRDSAAPRGGAQAPVSFLVRPR
ncbi:hypothetical protein ES703_111249 [subsurface metagenome]